MDSTRNDKATGRCKGTLLVNLRSFIVLNGGERAWEKFVASTAPADASLWRQPLLVSSWYPVGVWNRAVGMHLATSANPSAEMKRYARHVAERDLNTVMKLVLSLATPELIVARTAMFWARYFDMGALEPTKVGAHSWTLTITAPKGEEAGPGAVTCGDGVSGWVEQALRLSGARAPSVRHVQCRFRGASECLSEVIW